MAMHRGDNGTAGSSVILIGSERAGALVASSRFRPPLCALRLSRRPVPTSKAGRHSHLTQGKLYLLRHPHGAVDARLSFNAAGQITALECGPREIEPTAPS